MKECIKIKCAAYPWFINIQNTNKIIFWIKNKLSLPFYKTGSLNMWRQKCELYIFGKNGFILIHREITSLQLLKSGIRVSSCNLRKEHKEERDFPKGISILLRYNTFLSIMYWNAPKVLLLLVLLSRRCINFQSRFESGNKELKYCRDVSMLFFRGQY